MTLGLIFLVFSNIFDNISPFLIGLVLDKLMAEADFSEIGTLVAAVVVVNLLLTLTRYYWRIYWGRFHHSVAHDLRQKVFHKMGQLGPSFYSRTSVGELMSLITNDINVFRMAVGPGVLVLVDAFLNLMMIVPILFFYSSSWTWKTLIFMPVVTILSRLILNKIHSAARDQRDQFSRMSGETQELISGIRVVKGYAKESIFKRLYSLRSAKYRDASDRVGLWDAYFSPLMEFGVTTGAVILLLIGAPEVLRGEVTVGAFFAFYQYLQRMVWPASALGIGLSFHKQGQASMTRINELLDQPLDLADQGQFEPESFESIRFNNVNFTYPQSHRAALENISFELKAGESLGIVGPTGAGKSTLLTLLFRLYPVQEGSIYLNGRPAQEVDLTAYRNLIAPVPQETFLFSQSIADNLKLGSDLDAENLKALSELVGIEDEIQNIPGGYGAFLGEKGVNLSGGQKQRLALARALGRKSGLLILDDSFSAVDINTERQIQVALGQRLRPAETGGGREHQPQALILVSHRMESLRNMDKILVLNDGKMEAYGTHDELMGGLNTYQTLYNLQLDQEVDDGSQLSG